MRRHTGRVSLEPVQDVLSGGRGERRRGLSGWRLALVAGIVGVIIVIVAVVAVVRQSSPSRGGPDVHQQVRHPSTPSSSPSLPAILGVRYLAFPGLPVAVGGELLVLNGSPNTVTMVQPGQTTPGWTMRMPGLPVAAAAGGASSVWVATRDDGATAVRPFQLIRLARNSGQITARIAIPDVPFSLVASAGKVWVGSDHRLLSVDATTGRVRRLDVPGGAVIDLLADPAAHRLFGLLVGEARGQVVAWSDGDGHVIARHVESGTADTNGLSPTSMAIGFGKLWVTAGTQDGFHGALERLGLDRLQAFTPGVQADAVSAGSTIAAGAGALWLTGSDPDGTPTLSCFKPVTPDYARHAAFALPDNFDPQEPSGKHLVVIGSRVYVRGINRVQEIAASAAC